MRGKSLTCRQRRPFHLRSVTLEAVLDRLIERGPSRQVKDLPRIGVAEPSKQSRETGMETETHRDEFSRRITILG